MDIMENVQMEVMNMDISERLQELRKKEGYSQEQVAEMLGLSRQAISKWESGQGKPEVCCGRRGDLCCPDNRKAGN